MSSHQTTWADLSSCRVGIWGLGVEGGANLRRLMAERGQPVLVDDQPGVSELEGHPVWTTAGGGWDELARCDVVIKTPGISRYRPDVEALASRGVPVVGGLGLWMADADPRRVICVTGTKGKSTTVAICGYVLGRLGHDVLVGGNLGQPPYDPAIGSHDLYVIETSSFQVTDLVTAPRVVAVTSLSPDHLDWHGDTETYYRDKLSLTTKPGVEVTVIDGASSELRRRQDLLGAPRVEVCQDDDRWDGAWIEALGLLGHHNRRNAMVARALLRAIDIPEADDPELLTEAAAGFPGLESRLRTVGQVGGVTFVDDSLSTNVLPALAALDAFPGRRVAIIVGGHDRGVDYLPLAAGIASRSEPTMTVALPDTGRRVVQALADQPGEAPAEVALVDDLEAAVKAAWPWARPDGVVLLSPAAPSFGRFRNYREPAQAFREAMLRVTGPMD